jgi:hypothetical protein
LRGDAIDDVGARCGDTRLASCGPGLREAGSVRGVSARMRIKLLAIRAALIAQRLAALRAA